MAELVFFHGTMNCGKSTLALQTHHNQQQAGRAGLLLSLHDRNGAMISTRIGLSQPAMVSSAAKRPAARRVRPPVTTGSAARPTCRPDGPPSSARGGRPLGGRA